MRLRLVDLNSVEAFANQGLLEGASICKLKISRHDVLYKKTKVKFGASTHRSEGLLDYVHINIWGPTKTVSPGRHWYFVSFIYDTSKRCWVISYETKI